jgi:predicted RND superfamily exporter protein
MLVLVFFLVSTVFLGYSASRIYLDAGFTKLLPMKHPFMKTYAHFQKDFGGANQILVALTVKKGDIFTPEFFTALRKATDDIFFIPGVDRSRVFSLWTPNVRYTEIIEGGIAAGNMIPDGFEPTPEGLEQVRQNILKSEYLGRLVANDFTSAMIACDLQEVDPTTGEKLDFIKVARELESVREKFAGENMDVHIIGFAKFIGDMVDGVAVTLGFFGAAFLSTLVIVFWYTQSIKYTILVVLNALTAVIWQVGLLSLFGYGIDPMGTLVPFLVFAIAISHGMQMVRGCMSEVFSGHTPVEAAENALKKLGIPSLTALVTDIIGFATILLIQIRIIQEMAIGASIGVAAIAIVDMFLLPMLLSYMSVDDAYRQKLKKRADFMAPLWRALSNVAERGWAAAIILIAVLLLVLGWNTSKQVRIGDSQAGVPELRSDSRYNLDTEAIISKFAIGVDSLVVFAESKPDACIDHDAMKYIDDFAWYMTGVAGVQSVESLPGVVKQLSAAWNEASLKWRVLSRNPQVLGQACWYVPSTSGLMNKNFSVMPVRIYTKDHRAETISHILNSAETYIAAHPSENVRMRFAGGNVGVMGATNQVVAKEQLPIVLYVYLATILFVLISFRSLPALLCILLPLGLVSVLGYAVMALLGIGLKVNTLPVVSLGVGVGVDYGIYLYSTLVALRWKSESLREAYEKTLNDTGNAILLTGISLGLATATWIFSPLKFQADMGILLTFLFIFNMVGAVFILPALARWILRKRRTSVQSNGVVPFKLSQNQKAPIKHSA